MRGLPSGRRGRLLVDGAGAAAIAGLILATVVVSRAGQGTSQSSPSASAATSPSPASSPETPSGPATVRWFTGLGSGTAPSYIDEQKAIAARFNGSQSEIVLKLEIVPNANAYDVLKTAIAAGNVPDIIGPVGVKGRNGFEGQFMDLTDQVEKQHYDLPQFPPALVNFFRQGKDGLIGLPYLIYPGYIWYNKDFFTRAGLPNLPTRVGEPYRGKTWDWANLAEVAAQLTLDTTGRKSTDPAFDPEKIAQYGMDFQWCDGRRIVSLFGGGSFVAPDGKTAQIPAAWRDGFSWYYDAIWRGHFVPNGAAESSKLLAQGNGQSSGNVAMNAAWGWSIGSIWDSLAGTARMKSWDIGVVPQWKGATSSPLDADAFSIAKATKHPAEAFKAMLAIMADPDLMRRYGGLPALPSAQFAYTSMMDATLAPVFPGIKVSWSVLNEMAAHPAIPSHESNMPAFTQSSNDYGAFLTKLQSKPDLNLDVEISALQATLQADFDAVAAQ